MMGFFRKVYELFRHVDPQEYQAHTPEVIPQETASSAMGNQRMSTPSSWALSPGDQHELTSWMLHFLQERPADGRFTMGILNSAGAIPVNTREGFLYAAAHAQGKLDDAWQEYHRHFKASLHHPDIDAELLVSGKSSIGNL
jgi:hypothetical protein